MKLRCKPGDLAIIVSAVYVPEMIGELVIVERLAVPGEFHARTDSDLFSTWIVRSAVEGKKLPVGWPNGHTEYWLRRPLGDEYLRPIRDENGEDESLSWSRPKQEETS